tara:strand:+ start:76 stop:495 length:420 start_codon:yes stop_codon:yes gene_type:complete
MTTFIVNSDKTIQMELTDTMNHLKQLIIKEFNLDCKYIDLEFNLDKPIRGFGKMNLESGIIPRTMDNFPFNRYNLEGKTVNCKFIPVTDYLPKIISNSDVPQSVYQPPGMKTKNNTDNNNKDNNTINYDLNSPTDFPSL